MELIAHADKCAEVGDWRVAGLVELGAVALAVQIPDWHVDDEDPKPTVKEAFKARYPAWGTLRDVINGIKHPANYKNVIEMHPKWEDPNFWEKGGHHGELIVPYEDRCRSVQSLIKEFCESYLAALAATELPSAR